MAEPWFEPNTFGAYFGGIVGGVGGSLVGIWGGICGGYLVPRGKARGLVMGSFMVLTAIGIVFLAIGIYAFAVGQPYGIWYSFGLLGLIFSLVCGGMIPTISHRYKESENRKIAAESIRNS